ncbi:c-type cytochrome [Verrucomicrobiaceae bacterium 227]
MKRFSLLGLLVAPLLAQEKFDAVAEGKKTFDTMGCMECHVTAPDDESLKTGPSLYGLFLTTPRDRDVIPKGKNQPVTIKADQAYFNRSVRNSWDEVAVHESETHKDLTYPPAMPMYPKEVVSDQDLENLWHYLRTLTPDEQSGPATVMLEKKAEARPKSLLEIPNEVLVTSRPRVFRAPLQGSSGRAIHVGLPNGRNFTFDPQSLSIRNVWNGGFLNLSKERKGRGQPGSSRGHDNKMLVESKSLIQPLDASGNPISFEFKEPDVLDHAAIKKWLWDDQDFSARLASTDAGFLGHSLSAEGSFPTFHFRVGSNTISQIIDFGDEGDLMITVSGVTTPMKFRVDTSKLGEVQIDGETLTGDVFSLDPKNGTLHHIYAKLPTGLVARPRLDREEDWTPQPLVKKPSQPGNVPLQLPAGYSIETWEAPKDLYGRDQLFEPIGIAVAKDGTIVVTTRTAGVWRIRDNYWSLFAEGTYEALGVEIEDDHGDRIVIMQKPEMTRLTDTNGDGRADQFDTVCDDYGFHGNYHEYAHGPARDAEGNYYFALNLSHGGDEKTSWRAGGPYMGSMGGYRGWACRVTPDGKFEPYANGLRSPAGIGVDPDGRLWYAENQGEYVGSSKVVPLEQGKFYGHLSGLVSLPGMNPDSRELNFENWKYKIRKGAVWLPHGKLANSPGHPTWDTTGGKFGIFGGQMFIGDQTLSTFLRVETQKLNGIDQGFVIPFAFGLHAGAMRPCFLPDGSLLIGQTGRGWGARGGRQDSLQRVIYDGKTIAPDLHRLTPTKEGFTISLTQPLQKGVTNDQLLKSLSMESWFYENTGRYGSPEHDKRKDTISSVTISDDRKTVSVIIEGFSKKRSLDRIHHLKLQTDQLFATEAWPTLEAYYTLRELP